MVKRIAAPPRPGVELRSSATSCCPLCSSWCCSSACSSAPSPARATPRCWSSRSASRSHVAATASTSWTTAAGAQGLSLVADAKDAAATLTYQRRGPTARRRARHERPRPARRGAPRPRPRRAQARARAARERRQQGGEDLRAEPRLHGAELTGAGGGAAPATTPARARAHPRRSTSCAPRPTCSPTTTCCAALTEPRVQLTSYGKGAAQGARAGRAAAHRAATASWCTDVAQGGRKDVRLLLYYDRVPSLLGLKTVLPGRVPARLPLPAQLAAGRELGPLAEQARCAVRHPRRRARRAQPHAGGALCCSATGTCWRSSHRRASSSTLLARQGASARGAGLAPSRPRPCGAIRRIRASAGHAPRVDPGARVRRGRARGAEDVGWRRGRQRASCAARWTAAQLEGWLAKLLVVPRRVDARVPVQGQVVGTPRAARAGTSTASPAT